MAFETGLNITIDSRGARTGAAAVRAELGSIGAAARSAIGVVEGAFDRLRRQLFNLRNVFLGAGVGLVAKGFLDVARETENLSVRLRFLLGSVSKANDAFRAMQQYASTVAFSFEEIQRAGTTLTAVTRDVGELTKILRITGDLAAATGLSFELTAQQMVRAFSAGIGAADLFRERGVTAMLGFQAGVAISAKETKEQIFRLWDDATFSLRGAAGAMSTTWDGLTSFLGDKWFRFRGIVMDAAPFEFVKGAVKALNDYLDANFDSVEDAGKRLGETLVDAFTRVVIGMARLLDVIRPVIDFTFDAIGRLVTAFNQSPEFVQQFGLLGALLLGKKGLLTLGTGLLLADKIADLSGKLLDKLGVPDDSVLRDIFQGGSGEGPISIPIPKGPKPGSFEEMAINALAAIDKAQRQLRESSAKALVESAATATGSVEKLDKATVDVIKSLETENQQLMLLEKATKDGGRAIEDANDAIDAQNALLKAGVTASSASGQEILELVVANNELERSIQRTTDARENADKVRKQIAEEAIREHEREAEDEARRLSRPFEIAAENIQSSFSDAFFSIFRKGELSFKSLASSIKDIFARMLAELVTLAIARPIIIPVITSVGGILGLPSSSIGALTQSLGGAPTSLLGGGNFLSGLGNINLAGLLGGKTVAGITSAGGIGAFTSEAALTGSGLTGGATLTLGGLLSGIGAGFAGGSLLNSLLGGNRTGGMIGSGGGALAGALIGSAVPGIGTLLGGLLGGGAGGLLGGLFGPGKSVGPVSQALLGISNGALGIRAVGTDNGGTAAVGRALGEAVIQAVSAIQQQVGGNTLTGGGLTIGSIPNRGGFFVNQNQFGEDQAGAVNFAVRSFLQSASFGSNLDAIVQKSAKIRSTVEEISSDVTFAKTLLDPEASANTLANLIDELSTNFDATAKRAQELGISFDKVVDALEKSKAELLKTATGGIQDLLTQLGIVSGGLATPQERVANAQTAFADLVAKAAGGDLEAIAQVPTAAQSLLSVAREVFASGPEFARIFKEVNISLNDILDRARDQINAVQIAEPTLAAVVAASPIQAAPQASSSRILSAKELREIRGDRAHGGFIFGADGPFSDSILTPTSPGEFVVQASAVRRFGVGALSRINRGEQIGGEDDTTMATGFTEVVRQLARLNMEISELRRQTAKQAEDIASLIRQLRRQAA